MALTAEQKAFIDWQLQQIDPLTNRRIGDIVAEKGLDPYRDEVAQFAQDQIDRAQNQKAAGGQIETIAAWEDPNWYDKQMAKEQAELERRQRLDREWQEYGAAGGNLPVLGPSNDPNLGNVRGVSPYNPSAGNPPLPGADPLTPGPQPGGGGTTGGATGGGTTSGQGVIDAGISTNDNVMGGIGTTGVVYGPDGRMFSSAAAALAAGVANYSYTKPLLNQNNQGLINNAGNQMPTYQVPFNPGTGGLITGANEQLFKMPTGVQFPG